MNDEQLTPEQIKASIVPKSDQLNADSLLTGPLTVTITNVRRGDKEQPIIVDIDGGHQPYKPCKSMRRILIAAYSDDPKLWIGQRMTLYCDPEVLWAGVKVGGIRISHLSGCNSPRQFLITQTRGKRIQVTILPINDMPTDKDREQIEKFKGVIADALSLEALKEIGLLLKQMPKSVQDAVRGDYGERQKALKATPIEVPKNRKPDPEPPPADLEEYRQALAACNSIANCHEFRRDILPGAPEAIRAAVETLLIERETNIANNGVQA